MSSKKRRIRSPHPGVKLKERRLPSGAVVYRAIYADPETGRDVYVTLDRVALSTAEARRDWAVRKSKQLAKRRMDIEAGAPRHARVEIGKAVDEYIDGCDKRLRAGTMTIYRKSPVGPVLRA